MFVLDTNTVSYFFRGEPGVVTHLLATSPRDIAVPAIVTFELKAGLMRLPDGKSKAERLDALEAFLNGLDILPFDAQAADEAAAIRARLHAAGTPIGPYDILIAATTKVRHATLVTHNLREFARIEGLVIEDWHSA